MVELIVIFILLLPSGSVITTTKHISPIISKEPSMTNYEYCKKIVIPNEIKMYEGEVEVIALSCEETKERDSA